MGNWAFIREVIRCHHDSPRAKIHQKGKRPVWIVGQYACKISRPNIFRRWEIRNHTNKQKKTTTTTILRPFVRDYPGDPVPEETFTHPPSCSSNLYQLLPSTTIHSILPVQIMCLAIFLHNLSPKTKKNKITHSKLSIPPYYRMVG